MRLNVILFTIVLGGLISGAVFFIFGYPVDVPTANRKAEPPSGAQAFLLPVTETSYLPVRDFNISEPVVEATAAALYDVKSGRFLYTQNINKRLPIASITKLMTAVVIIDSLDLANIYVVPAESVNVDGFGADLFKGEQIYGHDLFKIMLVKSSNDAALTFAAVAQKSGIDLVAKMNEKARQFGMTNTWFTDPAGLDDQSAFSTVADLVKLVYRASDYDPIIKILIMPAMDVSSVDGRINHHLINTNQLLGRLPNIIFGKTGYTDKALGTMVLEAKINETGDSVISIVLGSNDRFGETQKLIEWGKNAYSWK